MAKVKQDRIVSIQLATESYDKHGDTSVANTTHASSRVVSVPCSEAQAAELTAKLAALIAEPLAASQPEEDG